MLGHVLIAEEPFIVSVSVLKHTFHVSQRVVCVLRKTSPFLRVPDAIFSCFVALNANSRRGLFTKKSVAKLEHVLDSLFILFLFF